MNAKTRENRTKQQKRSSRQKRASGESIGDDELSTGDYEKETLANSRTRDLKPGTKKAKPPSSVQKTAKELYLHRNTVSYRLHRITDLCQVDLSDSQTRFLLNVSFQIIAYMKRGLLKGEI